MSAGSKHSEKSHFPHAGIARDGWSNSEEATATCFCGAVQMAFPLKEPGYAGAFICNCTDCRKITASTFASNFITKDSHTRFLRGEDNLSSWGQAETIATGYKMTNYFCKTCGSLMYRVGEGFPGVKIMRLGTVDDFSLVEEVLKPGVEQFTKDRVGWLSGAQDVKQVEGAYYGTEKKSEKKQNL